MNILNYIELILALVAIFLTALNWFIRQKICLVEQRINRLEEFEKRSQDAFILLREIKGKLDILLKNFS